jgi:hypothetical protein
MVVSGLDLQLIELMLEPSPIRGGDGSGGEPVAGVTRGQLRDVVLAGITSSPKESEQEPYVAALLAMSRAFPCQKKGPQRAK